MKTAMADDPRIRYEFIRLKQRGLTNREIAERLNVEEHTVTRIQRKVTEIYRERLQEKIDEDIADFLMKVDFLYAEVIKERDEAEHPKDRAYILGVANKILDDKRKFLVSHEKFPSAIQKHEVQISELVAALNEPKKEDKNGGDSSGDE